ncbi:MAG: V-type ATP synthase subunit E [Anaerolineae bacterium]
MSVDENLRALTQAVLREAQDEAQRILAEAKAKAMIIKQEAQRQAQAEREDILSLARRQAERLHSQAIAAAQLQARKMLLERREQLLQRVFQAVEKQLPSVPQRPDYEQLVRQWVKEAVLCVGDSDLRIRADPQTQEVLRGGLLTELAQELGIHLGLGETLQRGVGVIVETADGRRQYDNTLEARLVRQWDGLRTVVYHLLTGDAQ